jgi:hypothetical protein
MDCNCYVKRLGAEALFTLHYGAHNPRCPVYRASGDEVDRKWDDIFRAKNERP